MKIYSDFPARRALQITADVAAIAISGIGIWLGIVVGSAIAALAEVGRQLESAGRDFSGAMADAGNALGQVPFVGSAVRVPFDSASNTGTLLQSAGRTTQDFITTTALVVGAVIAIVIVFVVCWSWLRRRFRFIRRATEANRLAKLADGTDLLALRALVNGKKKGIAAAGEYPVQSWRNGDPVVVNRLAALELREAGVRIAR